MHDLGGRVAGMLEALEVTVLRAACTLCTIMYSTHTFMAEAA